LRVEGLSPEKARVQSRYGHVFQAPALYPWRNVERNVRLPLEPMGLPKAEQKARTEKFLDVVRAARPCDRRRLGTTLGSSGPFGDRNLTLTLAAARAPDD
jgi:ABC-type taurine transport system ATPase subunit